MDIRKSTIEGLIDRGVKFVHSNQLSWGEIAIYSLTNELHPKRTFRSTIFATALALHSLLDLDRSASLDSIVRKGIRFIDDNREKNVWRYFGTGSEYQPDLDTTSCCLSLLFELGEIKETSFVDSLLAHRDPATKLFYTWMWQSPISENDCDSAVNANVLWLYSLLNKSHMVGEVVEFIIRESLDLHTQNSQIWYFSPRIFSYFVSRAFATGNAADLIRVRDPIASYLKFSQDEEGGWDNSIETAFALNALMNFEIYDASVEKGVGYLVDRADARDGFWDADFVDALGSYGSEEVTTAICVEALNRYVKKM